MVEVVRFCHNKRFESQPNLANYLVRNVMQDSNETKSLLIRLLRQLIFWIEGKDRFFYDFFSQTKKDESFISLRKMMPAQKKLLIVAVFQSDTLTIPNN